MPFTHAEILQQPSLWPDTVRRARDTNFGVLESPILTGAGTSAYAAMAVAAGWPGARAVPSTELFLDGAEGVVISLARSGDSPESCAVVDKLPRARHIAITCNEGGKLARHPGVEALILDPRTNDRSLAMTSSFSNLVLAGLTLARPQEVEAALPALCCDWERQFARLEATAQALAERSPARAVALASWPLAGAAREACLKLLELTAGRIAAMPETYLGLRHGPMSFLEPGTWVLCFLSSDPLRRRYELDLVRELRAKGLGRLIALGDAGEDARLFDHLAETAASRLPDQLRTPAEIVFPQLLAYHASLRLGLDPDNPSPGSVINRVVQGVVIYE